MTDLFRTLALSFAILASAVATPAVAQSEWDGVARVVAIGDLHGEYDKFVDMLNTAGLIDAHGDWSGGQTHLVQLGDVPDRGADTRKVIEHLMRLEPQAIRAGGRVHALIGNHEAMNVEGDLRYVSAGEYAAFVDRGSARKRDAYWRQWVAALRASPPAEGLPVIDETFRAKWNEEYPLGYVEHRLAWSPQGRYGNWIAGHSAVVRINDTLYLHAGIGPLFPPLSIEGINDAVRYALQKAPVDPALADITTNEEGPLWYRGLALNAETTEAPHLAALLARYRVARIVVGHTKRAPMVLPRFNGRVIVADVAVPDGQTDPRAWLVQEGGAVAAMHRGTRVAIGGADPCAYFAAVAALEPPNAANQRLVANCGAPQGAVAAQSSGSER
jgi:Calcineurin-like phosphoesterase